MGGYYQGNTGKAQGNSQQQRPAEPGLPVVMNLVIDGPCLSEDVGHYTDSPEIER